jgi:hypothetical protein
MTLREDKAINRLVDAIEAFRQTWTNRYLNHNSVILFLNKYDTLVRKLVDEGCHLEDYFPDFSDYKTPDKCEWKRLAQDGEDQRVTRAKLFICEQFMSITAEPIRPRKASEVKRQDSKSKRIFLLHTFRLEFS